MMLDDGGMTLPDFGDPGAVIGFMATVAFLTFMGRAGKIGRLGARMGGDPAEPAQQVTVPTPDGGQVSHDATGIDPAVLAIFQAHAATIESMQTRLAKQAGDIHDLQKREDRLAKHIVLLKKGVESGAFPPWPDDPQ